MGQGRADNDPYSWPTLAGGVPQEGGERDELEGAFVGRGKNDRGRFTRLQCFEPPAGTEAPTVTGFESGKIEFGVRRNEVVAGGEIGREKSFRDLDANCMAAVIFRTGVAIPISKEAGERILRTRFQGTAEHIAGRMRIHDRIVV